MIGSRRADRNPRRFAAATGLRPAARRSCRWSRRRPRRSSWPASD